MKDRNLLLFASVLLLIPLLLATGCGKKKATNAAAGVTPQATQAAQATQPPQATQATGAAAGASPTRAAGVSPTAVSTPVIALTVASGTGASTIEACRLVTKDEAAAALGEGVKDPDGVNVGTQDLAPGLTATISSCTFDSSSGARSVEVTFWKAGGTVASQLRQAFEQLLCAQKERVTGLGDLACWYDSTKTELQVLKGATFVDFQITQASGPDRSEALKTLAQKALARIQ